MSATYGWDDDYGHAGVFHAFDGGDPPHDYELHYIQWAFDDIFYQVFEPKTLWWWVGFPYPHYTDCGPAYGRLMCYMQNYRSSTTWANVIEGIDKGEDRVDWGKHFESTFLYVGHGGYEEWGGVWHYGFAEHGYGIDTRNLPKIWDTNVSDHISPHYPQNYHHFVFLWVCRNGNERGNNNPVHGMPYAWTQRLTLSENGYANADGSGYCFIGFEDASPMLSYRLTGLRPTQLHKHWLVFFYYYALYGYYTYTVKQALDLASQAAGYTGGFSTTGLYQGTSTWWPGGDGKPEGYNYPSKMRVYGDGNIYLPTHIFVGGPYG